MTRVWAETGDIFFTRSRTILGRLIRWAESDPGETNGVWANHTGVVVAAGWMVPPDVDVGPGTQAQVIEALGRVKHQRWWDAHKDEDTEVRVFAPVPKLNEQDRAVFRRAAAGYVGARYGAWKLIFHLADRALFGGRKVLSRLLFIESRPICSFLAARVFAEVGRTFGMPPQAADPDEQLDYCLTHPDQWRER